MTNDKDTAEAYSNLLGNETYTTINRSGKRFSLDKEYIENQEERDKFLDYVNDFEFGKLKLPKPDLVIFLDVPVEVSKKLADSRGEYKSGNKKDILEQDISHLTKAYNSGKYVANKYGWTQISCLNESGNLKSIEEISNDIFEVVKKLFNK